MREGKGGGGAEGRVEGRVSVCENERERVCASERVFVCERVCERESVCERERESVCV